MKKIIEIFKQYKYKLTLIYVFMLLTELSNIIQPFLLGKSVDGLIKGKFTWTFWLSISYVISNLFIYKRMVYDTKVYTKIYNDIVLKFLSNSKHSSSKKTARTDMVHEIINVLESYVHYYISTLVTIIGSIGFIFYTNWVVGVLVVMALLFILGGVLIYYKKIQQVVNVRNNHIENKVTSIHGGYDTSRSFFNRRRKLEIIESNLQGRNWFLAGSIRSLFLISSIVVLVMTTKGITTGSLITIYSYLNNFLISLLSIPVAFEMYSRLNNIIKRVE